MTSNYQAIWHIHSYIKLATITVINVTIMIRHNRQSVLPSTSYKHAILGVADISNTASLSLEVA